MNKPASYKNHLLTAWPAADITRLAAYLRPVTLEQRQRLDDGDKYAYFVEEGVASVVVRMAKGQTVEVGIIAREGLVGLSLLLGTGSTRSRTFVQIAGSGFRIDAKMLREAFYASVQVRQSVYKYMHAFMSQTAQTAACNRLHAIEQRLALWLLSCRDRVESDRFELTHEFLGHMLGAPRSTVTVAAAPLQRAGVIDCSRGAVTILNRRGLERAACECYRTVRDEYCRLSLLPRRRSSLGK